MLARTRADSDQGARSAPGQEEALGVLERRGGCSYDPHIVDAVPEVGPDLVRPLADADAWDADLARIPNPTVG